VIIAVIDSGTEYYHDDLQPNMWTNEDEIENNGVDDDSNGFIDDYRGWDFANGDNDPVGPYEHGTLVAGIVSGRRNNFEGIAGIAGGDFFSQGCQIMGLGVGDFFPDGSAIDDAIIYATDMGAQVITLSLSVSSSSAIDAAIEYAVAEGVFIDCAAGNNGPSVGYPASHPDVMAVAATDHDDEVAGFSNPGPEVEVAAPGVDILSTSENGGYDESSGTSFAAPQVAGVAGLMFSLGPCVTAEDVRQTLIDTAVDIEAPGFDLDTGHGRIDAFAALQALIDVGIPNGCLCPADFDGSGDVDVNDLLTMLADWGACADCAADLDDSGMVDVDDLLDLLAAWGPCA
jgi:subtilisin family serine protease